jgi:hypothetical protein
VTDQHPTVPTWTAEPPPPPTRRRLLGPGLVAALIAVVVLFGGVGLYAARQAAGAADGAGSPEAAATGLLTALGEQDLDRAAGYLPAEEALLLDTYRDRATALLAARMTGPGVQPRSGLQLTARDVRFQRITGLGGVDVGVVELVGGTVGGRDPRGAKLELPAAELNRRLAEQSKGAIKALRAVAVRGDDDRWRVSLLATAAEQARLAAGAAEPDWDQLAGAAQPAAPGAASPEAAVDDLVAAAETGDPQAALERLSPGERRVLAAYRPLLAHQGAVPKAGAVRIEGLKTRTEQVSDDVAKVHATAGRLAGSLGGNQARTLDEAMAKGEAPYVVTIRQGGTWYPSLVFTVTDWMLTRAERERP